jgi:16S rRNA (guanine(527)-N(7))-methyltransferase RsmG
LTAYLELLDDWSTRVNLTGARTPAERAALLVGDVLPAVDLLQGTTLLDLGSGNGSPGLVLALLRPELRVTLLEPRQKRWAFLREAARVVGRPEIEVVRQRHDQWQGPPVENLTLRGLGLPIESLRPLLTATGQVLVFGNPRTTTGMRMDVVGEGRSRICRLRCST